MVEVAQNQPKRLLALPANRDAAFDLAQRSACTRLKSMTSSSESRLGSLAVPDRPAGQTSWPPRQPDGWPEYVAACQALLANATLASVEICPEATTANLATLSANLGCELGQAPYDSVLEFKRGQLLGYQGDPQTISTVRNKASRTFEISMATTEATIAAHCEEDGFAFLLIGGPDPALIRGAADHFAERL